VLVLGVLAFAGGYWLVSKGDADAPRFATSAVARGNLTVTVSATGTLQPTNQVDVGSELSGTIERVLVDDNSVVKKGQELARLDVSKLRDQIADARAALLAAEASVAQNEATVRETSASLARQQEVFRLSAGKVPSQAELDSATASLARARANLAAAQAGVTQAGASLSSNLTNLAKASIRSPINGVVLARKVEPGQTVAASLQAPVLFTLAEDLSEMELLVNVDEADVGQVREGQSASFSVDAYPGRKYPADIRRVSFGSQTTEGVVSYPTLLQVSNADLSLRPGMTATAEIVTTQRKDVLLVPNAALRFTPPNATGDAGKGSKGGMSFSLMPRPPGSGKPKSRLPEDNGDTMRRVWVLQDGQPRAVDVKTGASNGRMTEIVSGDLKPGMPVIVDLLSPGQS
jgi:HlyD family secretion protein